MSVKLIVPWKETPTAEERQAFLQQVKAQLRGELLERAQNHVHDWAVAGQIVEKAFKQFDHYLAQSGRIGRVEIFLQKLVDKLAARRTEAAMPAKPQSQRSRQPSPTSDMQRQARIREIEVKLIWAAQGRGEDGDVEAYFTEYVLLTRARLLRKAHRVTGSLDTAHDIVQEGYLALHQQLPRKRLNGSLEAWLAGVVANKALEHVRNRERQRRLLAAGAGQPRDVATPDDLLARAEQEVEMQRRIECLPERQRQALTLRWHEGLGYGQIAEFLAVSPESARQYCCRALARICGERCEDPGETKS